ncbi:unnamed protein product [Sphagnum jensenii]|uniref:TOG domain-containing protein n=1 Tax=Sphagnum jensenii TaxID=128206 RepID=A0ABP0WSL4_9BRYO
MAQTRGGAGGKGLRGSGGKAVLMMELKNRILAALNKLADRDTQQLAVEDLERLSESLSSEGLSMFLSCLYETDGQQKSAVRRECIKLFGTLATLHGGEALAPHAPKIVANIVRRLKDPDSNIRDACVDAMGILASQIGGGGGGGAEATGAGGSINIFVKPLLEALGEQNRNLQVGASLCLARVIECTKDPNTGTLQRLCPRILKLLSSPSFLANASLLPAIGGLAQVPGVVDGSSLKTLISTVEEELEGTEWATRKAAADTLASLATALGPMALSASKASCTAALVTCRFDKVKPVRDSVAEALQLWKTIPDVGDSPAATPPSSTGDVQAVNASFPATNIRPKSVSEKVGSSLKKKTPPPLGDKKPNPDFFSKLQNGAMRASGDWQIEVAVPQRLSPTGLSLENGGTGNDADGVVEHHHGNGMEPILEASSPPLPNGFGGFVTPKDRSYKDRIETKAEPVHDPEQRSWDASVPVTSPDSSSGSYDEAAASAGAVAGPDWAMVCRQFQNMERQQCIIMEMLQEFMVGVHESMQGLEGRVRRLERVVDGIARSASSTERLPTGGGSPTLETTTGRSMGRFLAAADFLGAKIRKVNGERTVFADLLPRSGRSIDSSSLKTPDSWSGAWDGSYNLGAGPAPRTGGLPGNVISEAATRRLSSFSSNFTGKHGCEEVESEQVVNRQSWDRASSGPMQQGGEGPSARSVWQASKDEATTVAAIRGAAPPDKPTSRQTDKTKEYKSECRSSTTTGGNKTGSGGGAFWMLWSRATECVRSGDLNGAYVEILRSGDELLLMRMMSRTGPVLHQLNRATALQLVCSITRMLRQQGFLESVIPWIQQVSDLTTSNGADSLGLSGEVRKDLLMSLQDASAMELAESWMSNTISQLIMQLSNVSSS